MADLGCYLRSGEEAVLGKGDEKGGGLLPDLEVGVLAVALICLLLLDGDAAHKQQQGHEEDGRNDGNIVALLGVDGCQAKQPDAPPLHHLPKTAPEFHVSRRN